MAQYVNHTISTTAVSATPIALSDEGRMRAVSPAPTPRIPRVGGGRPPIPTAHPGVIPAHAGILNPERNQTP